MSTIAVNAITDASAGNTTSINGVTPNANNLVGKNRIINGNMMIDQRNAGASITPTAGVYALDRWVASINVASKFSLQQNAGSVTPPEGFSKYLGITSLSAYTLASGEFCTLTQYIEGSNVDDLNWGTSNAKAVTLSFWVRSSLTGTFGGAFNNSDSSRSYPFTYSISSANTWEKKSITIAGDTTGTWLTTNGRGIVVRLGFGSGSTYSGTAGSWSGSTYFTATGATSVVGTSGATFYITGVQLEAGSTATEFEHRQYGTELQLCQRYYWRQFFSGSNVLYNRVYWSGAGNNAIFDFPAPSGMRINGATVTCTPTTNGSGASFTYHPHGNIIIYRVSANGDNYFYSQDLAISAEL